MGSTTIFAAEECTTGNYKVNINELSICCPPCEHIKNSKICLDNTRQEECRCRQGYGCFSKSCITCKPFPTCERSQLKKSVKETTEYDYYCENCPTGTFFEDASGICKPGKGQVATTKSNREGNNSTVPSTKKSEDSSSNWTSLMLYLILSMCIVLLIMYIIHLLIWKMKASQLLKKTGDQFHPHLLINRKPREDTDTWSCQYPEEEHGEEHRSGPIEMHCV
ncbi:tumor necrosis factor receptor superfamily member 18 [Hyla sarda]|uniref:tumor necrosis factor receptor superfamily member 18 n=1 Tax=Hyla sarda TaxID=327740 RepID=UPI0024C37345|nr:tumor necrosis factor receptor superfamily member 18 [Hyla sarda]